METEGLVELGTLVEITSFVDIGRLVDTQGLVELGIMVVLKKIVVKLKLYFGGHFRLKTPIVRPDFQN